MELKIQDEEFSGDTNLLLRPGNKYNLTEAFFLNKIRIFANETAKGLCSP